METRIQTLDILKDFHLITGARITLYDPDFNKIAAYPGTLSPFCKAVQRNESVRSLCLESDNRAFKIAGQTGRPYTYVCHCGLIETVAPIYNYGTLTGYFMMGQISDTDPESLKLIIDLSARYFKNKTEAEKASFDIPMLSTDKFKSYLNILEIISEYMTQTNRLPSRDRDLAASVKSYICKFYQKKLSVKFLCETFGCSRTTLMNTFKRESGITVGEYICQYRLSKAETMLTKGTESVKSVASSCGFRDQNYFTKVFKQKYGKTPTEYRFGVENLKLSTE